MSIEQNRLDINRQSNLGWEKWGTIPEVGKQGAFIKGTRREKP
jgi:hypothetical protein